MLLIFASGCFSYEKAKASISSYCLQENVLKIASIHCDEKIDLLLSLQMSLQSLKDSKQALRPLLETRFRSEQRP